MEEKRFNEVLKGLDELVEWNKGNGKILTSYGYKTKREVEELQRVEKEKQKL